MITTSDEAAPTLGKDGLGIEQQDQDAMCNTESKSADIAQERRRLEMKLCACLAIGGTNGLPIAVDRIKDRHLHQLAGAGMSRRDWSIADLEACTGSQAATAAEVAALARENPKWTVDDFRAFDALERAEAEADGRRLARS